MDRLLKSETYKQNKFFLILKTEENFKMALCGTNFKATLFGATAMPQKLKPWSSFALILL